MNRMGKILSYLTVIISVIIVTNFVLYKAGLAMAAPAPVPTPSTGSVNSASAGSDINESSLSISKLSNGQDFNILSIDSIPPALDSNSTMSGFMSYMFYFLFALGIVLSFFEGYRSELTDKSFSYYGLFLRTGLIAAAFLSWKQTGFSNFAQIILTLADRLQLYLLKQNVYSIGESVSQIVSSISGSLHNVSIPTVSSNGTASVKSGWNLNPVSWFAGAVHAITGTILMGILWFLFNLFYLIIQLIMAFVQLILLGLLFSICPIILGFETIPYTRGVFGKWMKMFIEISFWGVMVALEQLIFFTVLGKIVSINLPSSETGMGNILGVFTFAEAVTIFIVMILINVTVPYFVGKLFEGISNDAHERIQAISKPFKSIAVKTGNFRIR
jgi:TrbL/VirB6 plasmid conjugal transfer protein.